MQFVTVVACAALAVGCAGCTTLQEGPKRPITIDEDVAWARDLVNQDLLAFGAANPATKALLRNEIVTTRMYIADAEYHFYEARLTKDMQEEGFAATVANLGLTTSATLVPVAQTKTLLSALATGVTGVDKSITEKILLSNTIQALQTQMRADRKTQASIIYAKMLKDVGNNAKTITSIAEYTLPMAMSDADGYYQAGTVSSALIGLSKTVAIRDDNADSAKLVAGPNSVQTSNAKTISNPIVPPTMAARTVVIRDVTAPMKKVAPSGSAGEPTDPAVIASIRKTLCLSENGSLDEAAHKRLGIYLKSIGQPPSERFLHREMIFLNRLIKKNQTATCSLFG